MSVGFGKASRGRQIFQQMQKQDREIRVLYGLGRSKASPQNIQFPILGGGSSTPNTGNDRISRNGDAMKGPLGFLRQLGGLDVLGNLDLSVTGYFTSYIALTNLGGSSDFRSVTGAINDGQILVLYNNTGLPITVREASFTGNIETITHQDIVMNNLDFMIFIWDAHPGSLKQITAGSAQIAGANQSLSNLTNPTSINQDLLPSSANSKNLGSQADYWSVLFAKETLFVDPTDPTNKFSTISYNTTTHFLEYEHSSPVLSGHIFLLNSAPILGVELDFSFGDTGYIDLYQSHRYTSATAGTASALPATPQGYHIVMINGVKRKMPYYNV